jgi:hypothetical protein
MDIKEAYKGVEGLLMVGSSHLRNASSIEVGPQVIIKRVELQKEVNIQYQGVTRHLLSLQSSLMLPFIRIDKGS